MQELLKTAVNAFPVTVLTGPRQSGKTTLLKYLFPDYTYVSLETPDTLLNIKTDPRGFLNLYHQKVIIDEAQNYPELFSYIQEIVDSKKDSKILLSGSQNFLLAEQISQTLAGRAVLFELLPLTYTEYLSNPSISQHESLWGYLYNGSYPRPYQENIPVQLWYESYIRTYLERDVRRLINVKDLSQFQLFLRLCASQHGQEFNATSIANVIGISQTTVMNWISILEASYIIFRLRPYYNNFKKRLAKRPKLYFYDSAIVCHLLGIDSVAHLEIHSSRGAIFEGFIISEILKMQTTKPIKAQCYFWREHSGYEVDLLIELGQKLSAIEIKSGMTVSEHFFKGLMHFNDIASSAYDLKKYVIYGGDEDLAYGKIPVLSWKNLANIIG